MNTHATNLLTQLINGLYNATPTPELHAFQMLAAELKGAMKADTPPFCQPEYVDKPTEQTTDADGWVVNTGDRPSRVYLDAIMHKDGKITHLSGQDRLPILWIWDTENTTIAKYKPNNNQ